MKLKAAFMFVAPEVDQGKHHALIETPVLDLKIAGVKNYDEAEKMTRSLVAEGVKAIELCAGFGNEGTARVARAADGKAVVGSVKFDCHPGFDYKSGDQMFG